MKGWFSRLGRRPREGKLEVLQLEQMVLRLQNQMAEEGEAIHEVQRAQVAMLEKLAKETHVLAVALRCMVNMRVVESLRGDIGSMADPRGVLGVVAAESQGLVPNELPKREVRELTSDGMAFSAWLDELKGRGFLSCTL